MNRTATHSAAAARALVAIAMATLLIRPAAAQEQLWITQFGTFELEIAQAVAPDGAGGVFVGGTTESSLGGPLAGMIDGFLAHYDGSGNQLWIRQFGTAANDIVFALAPDGSGGVFVGGATEGSLGGPVQGPGDAFLARYDGEGNLIWINQFGTASGADIRALAHDGSGGVFATGGTGGNLGGPNAGARDGFVVRFDSLGNQIWIRQFGSSGTDFPTALALDGSGGVFVCGATDGTLGASSAGQNDVFLARFDGTGTQFWMRQFGTTGGDTAVGMATDGAGGVFMCGETGGSFGGIPTGGQDAWVGRFGGLGTQMWIRQFGTGGCCDIALALAPDGVGGVYVGGDVQGSLSGSSPGQNDPFLVHCDSMGFQFQFRLFGTPDFESVRACATDGAGGVYVAGVTGGNLAGTQAGHGDAYLGRYSAPPPCYADRDQSTGVGVLDIFDFLSFQNGFVIGDPDTCNCDITTGVVVCDIFDFLCFQNAFVAGCP